MRVVSLLFCLFLSSSVAQAATYYVSLTGNNGNSCASAQSSASARQTIASGMLCLTPGDTLYLKGGTYTERIDSNAQTIPTGTSWSSPVTIAAAPSETVLLMPTSGGNVLNLYAFATSYDIQYVIFDRLIFDGTNVTGATMGIQGDEGGGGGHTAHHIRIQNSEIRNAHFVASPDTNTGFPNVQVEAHDVTFFASRIHHAQSGYGFYMVGTNITVENCEIDNNYGYGIQQYISPAISGLTGTIIRGNLVHDNGTVGNVFGGTAMTLNHVSNVLVANNVIYNNPYGGINISYGNPNNVQIYNNTFYNNNTASGRNPGVIYIFAGVTNTVIRNNIFWQNGSPIVDNSGTGTVQNTNSTANPSFVNTGTSNFHLLAGSIGINGGVTLTAVPTDRDDVARPQGSAYDLGAYEFVEASSPITVYVAPAGDDARSCVTAQTITTPRQSVAAGLACLTTPGSTLSLRAGTYTAVIDTALQFVAGGTSWAAPTTIAAYAGEVVTLQLPGGTTGGVLSLGNAAQDHYLVFDRLILDGQNATNGNGIVVLPGAHHIRFQNGEVKNTYWESAYIYSANNVELLNSRFHDSTHEHGVHVVGTVDGTIIQGNDVSASVGSGIRAVGSDAPTGTITNTMIRNNKVHGTGTAAVYPGLALGGTGHTGAQVVNNVVYGNLAGVQVLSGASGAILANNTVVSNTNIGIQIDSGATSTSVLNTILAGNGGVPLLNNGTGTSQGTTLTTLPAFVDAPGGNYRLLVTAVTAIDTGTTVAEAATDADGVARPQGATYDLGAYEFVGTVPLGVLAGPPWQARGMFRR